VRQGQFREDLWFRLNVLPIHIPPLRERPEDVAPLVRHFAARSAARLGRPVKFDAGAVPLLAAYTWPGNVRELANIVERMAILATAELITAGDVARVLPQDGLRPIVTPGSDNEPWRDIALSETLDQYERELIAKALSASRGNVAEAARRLQTDRANLYRPHAPSRHRASNESRSMITLLLALATLQDTTIVIHPDSSSATLEHGRCHASCPKKSSGSTTPPGRPGSSAEPAAARQRMARQRRGAQRTGDRSGRVQGTLVVINGDLLFDQGAEVTGDVIVVGGTVNDTASARIGGEVRQYREPLL